jgi:methylenetetrahydrofolate--tRNA-(uracil-5-)-methyltransferase
MNAARLANGKEPVTAPAKSAVGALARYVSQAEAKTFQPANITFALLEPLPENLRRKVKRKRERHELQVKLALEEWDEWLGNF